MYCSTCFAASSNSLLNSPDFLATSPLDLVAAATQPHPPLAWEDNEDEEEEFLDDDEDLDIGDEDDEDFLDDEDEEDLEEGEEELLEDE